MDLFGANLLAILFITAITISFTIASYILHRDKTTKKEWFLGLIDDVRGELLGAVLTAIIFTLIVTTIEQRQDTLSQIDELVRSAGDNSNAIAIGSIHRLRELGLVTGEDSVLINVALSQASLQDAWLAEINFERSFMRGANLQHSLLWRANLRDSQLNDATLFDATLIEADLEGADLSGADLRGANLSSANLTNTDFTDTIFDTSTILPDSIFTVIRTSDGLNYDFEENSIVYWSSDTDMRRYTDPTYENYWQPSNLSE